jgi:putative hydrolase of HD superfamily
MRKKFSRELNRLIDFIKFLHEFREVYRYEGSKLGKKVETGSEHAYQVAMTAWFLIEQKKLKLNIELCFMYALAHDLVEVYAGDTFIFDKKLTASQKDRERKALQKITKRFSNFPNLIKIIKNYEAKKDKESKFVYAVDKILPPLQIYLEGGKLWKEKNVALDDLLKNKNDKILLSQDVNKYWLELSKYFIKNRKRIFPH